MDFMNIAFPLKLTRKLDSLSLKCFKRIILSDYVSKVQLKCNSKFPAGLRNYFTDIVIVTKMILFKSAL